MKWYGPRETCNSIHYPHWVIGLNTTGNWSFKIWLTCAQMMWGIDIIINIPCNHTSRKKVDSHNPLLIYLLSIVEPVNPSFVTGTPELLSTRAKPWWYKSLRPQLMCGLSDLYQVTMASTCTWLINVGVCACLCRHMMHIWHRSRGQLVLAGAPKTSFSR